LSAEDKKGFKMKYKITRLIEQPKMKEQAARWFHEKWGIPMEAYLESMEECLGKQNAVPQWYFVMDDEKIIAGLGVIEDDFHDRKDLAPNVCAVYVEEKYRRQGIAGEMLNFVCTDMEKKGVDTLYLVTDHTSFYERYGWTFLCMVGEDGGPELSRMYIHQMVAG